MSILCRKFLNRLTTTNRLQLVDVGSMGGVESEWQTIEQDIAITGFEPDTREFAKLMNRVVSTLKCTMMFQDLPG